MLPARTNTVVDTVPERPPRRISATVELPGYAYLRVPRGDPGAAFLNDAIPTEGFTTVSVEPAKPSRGLRQAAVVQVLNLWLEALEGRRIVDSLKRAPVSPAVIEKLRLSKPPVKGGARLLSLYLQQPQPASVRFCGSVHYDGRVRAIAGVFAMRKSRHGEQFLPQGKSAPRTGLWRLETIQLI